MQLGIVLVCGFWDSFSGALSLEKGALSWLFVGSSATFGIILSSKG